jgi:hypothetical protein
MTDARGLLKDYYDLLHARSFSEAVKLFNADHDVLWSIPGDGRLAGKYDTLPTILDALTRFYDGSSGSIIWPVHAICVAEDGEHACVSYRLRKVRGDDVRKIAAVDAWHVGKGGLEEVVTFVEEQREFDNWSSS